jgi:hypothetical protein
VRQKILQMDREVVIWDEPMHWEQVVESAQISQHKVTKLLGTGNGNGPPSGNLGCSNQVAEVRE